MKNTRLVIASFAVILCILAVRAYTLQGVDPMWDETVYLGYAKHFAGNGGFYEDIRPPGLPLILSLGYGMRGEGVLFGRILSIAAALLLAILLFSYTKREFDEETAIITVLMFCTSTLYFDLSGLILTEFFSLYFLLLGILFLKRPMLSGICFGIAFLFRFPIGLGILIAVIIYLIYSIRKPLEWVINSAKAGIGFLIILLPWFLFNYRMLPTLYVPWYQKMVWPILKAPGVIESTLWTQSQSFWYYAIEHVQLNPLYAFCIVGIVLIIIQRRYSSLSTVLGFCLFFLYFSSLAHKEFRYSIPILLFAAILAGYGIMSAYRSLVVKKIVRNSMPALFLLIIIISGFFVYQGIREEEPIGVLTNQNPNLAPERTILHVLLSKGDVIYTSMPQVILYTDKPVIANYYSLPVLVQEFHQNPNAQILVLSEDPVMCQDEACRTEAKRIMQSVMQRYKPVYYGFLTQYNKVIILSKDRNENTYGDVQSLFLLSEPVSLQSLPFNTDIFGIIRIDNAGDDDGNGTLYHEKPFSEIMQFFTHMNVPAHVNIIPISLTRLDKNSVSRLRKIIHDSHTVIIGQHGYDFVTHGTAAEFDGLSLDDQTARILSGKKILQEMLGIDTVVFVPSYNNGDSITMEAAYHNGFLWYSSIPSDDGTFEGIHRKDADMYLANAQGIIPVKSALEIIDTYKGTQDAVVMQISAGQVDENLQSIISELRKHGVRFATFDDYQSWAEYREELSFTIENNTVTLLGNGKSTEIATLAFARSMNITLSTNLERVGIVSTNVDNITLHINEKEYRLQPHQAVLHLE